jgi:hypothetical protein
MTDDDMPEWAKQMEARLTARLRKNGRITVRGFKRVSITVDAIRRDIADINGRIDAVRRDIADINGRLDGIDADLAGINEKLDEQ